jgi:hypothetical protein
LQQQAQKTERTSNDLRELSVRGQHLRARALEAKLDGAEITQVQAGCDELVAQLDQRLQIQSIRQMQHIADADARDDLSKVDGILQEIDSKYSGSTYQWCGERLVEAETRLNRIDKLCSQQVQEQCRKRQEDIRKRALKYRISQQKEYNLWAIGVLQEAIKGHSEATPWYWKNDREKLKTIISDRIGEIDPQHLHPVTHALFAEMFQKVLTDLKDNDLKVEVTRNVEQKPKKPISDF